MDKTKKVMINGHLEVTFLDADFVSIKDTDTNGIIIIHKSALELVVKMIKSNKEA